MSELQAKSKTRLRGFALKHHPSESSRLLSIHPQRVDAVFETFEIVFDSRMADRFMAGIGLQVTFGDIGQLVALMDQYVVPGFVLRRAAQCNLLIPFFGSRELSIDIDNNAPIVEFDMMYELADKEQWLIHAMHYHVR